MINISIKLYDQRSAHNPKLGDVSSHISYGEYSQSSLCICASHPLSLSDKICCKSTKKEISDSQRPSTYLVPSKNEVFKAGCQQAPCKATVLKSKFFCKYNVDMCSRTVRTFLEVCFNFIVDPKPGSQQTQSQKFRITESDRFFNQIKADFSSAQVK